MRYWPTSQLLAVFGRVNYILLGTVSSMKYGLIPGHLRRQTCKPPIKWMRTNVEGDQSAIVGGEKGLNSVLWQTSQQ